MVVCLVKHFVVWFSQVFCCRCFNIGEVGRLVLSEWLCDVYMESTSLLGIFAPCIVNAAEASQGRGIGI